MKRIRIETGSAEEFMEEHDDGVYLSSKYGVNRVDALCNPYR